MLIDNKTMLIKSSEKVKQQFEGILKEFVILNV